MKKTSRLFAAALASAALLFSLTGCPNVTDRNTPTPEVVPEEDPVYPEISNISVGVIPGEIYVFWDEYIPYGKVVNKPYLVYVEAIY